MKPHLLPILFAALLTNCIEKTGPPPAMMRLHVTPMQVFDGPHPVPQCRLTDWLARLIAEQAVARDVRLDFDYDVTLWRMLELMDEVCSAGAYAPDGRFSFNLHGSTEDDIPLFYPPVEESCCISETIGGADDWGEFTITIETPFRFVDFELTINEGDLSSGATRLSRDDLRKLLRERRRHGRLRVLLGANTSGTAGDLLPALRLCVQRGASVSFGVMMPYGAVDENSPAWRMLSRSVSHELPQPVFPKHPLDNFTRAVASISWPSAPPLLPASIQLTANGSSAATLLNPPGSNQTAPFPFADAPP